MKRFKNILLVSSNGVGDDDTLTQAVALAKRNDAQLTMVEVIEDATLPAQETSERHKRLSRMIASIENEGVKISTDILEGTAFLEIIRQVLRRGHDLVIIPAEGDVGFKHLFFGSTTMHLMRKCPCPVWVTKPRAHNDYERILVAVDPSPDAAEVDGLNTEILDLATSLTRLNDSELHIVHAWDITGKDLDTLRSEITEEIRDRVLRKNELMHRKPLDRLLGRYALDNVRHQVHLVRGDPGFELPKMAEEKQIDLIVMGSVVRTGIPGFIIGNTAEFVLRQMNCAVLTVKPAGFVTPVVLEE
jgi:nucleotide-binding universal stress UspA family protein